MLDRGVSLHEGALILNKPASTLRRWYIEGKIKKTAGRFPISELMRMKDALEVERRGYSTHELVLKLGIPERTLRRRFERLIRRRSPYLLRTPRGYRVLPEHLEKFVKELMKEA